MYTLPRVTGGSLEGASGGRRGALCGAPAVDEPQVRCVRRLYSATPPTITIIAITIPPAM